MPSAHQIVSTVKSQFYLDTIMCIDLNQLRTAIDANILCCCLQMGLMMNGLLIRVNCRTFCISRHIHHCQLVSLSFSTSQLDSEKELILVEAATKPYKPSNNVPDHIEILMDNAVKISIQVSKSPNHRQ
ncbi:hypothetical protein L5515_017350 [Caenorhabditis briggsae]|uniref:Uncharacterized protein n=1 Tax=Caenorhabditis briggsae TaxID=6238 RepID=A0AAE9JR67_CAEBR|nr:hypothetical protein L5515_017350 [Caenorhabditis briggsae]